MESMSNLSPRHSESCHWNPCCHLKQLMSVIIPIPPVSVQEHVAMITIPMLIVGFISLSIQTHDRFHPINWLKAMAIP
jgi:hypothetical protein